MNNLDIVNFRDVAQELDTLYNLPNSPKPAELKIKIARGENDPKTKVEKEFIVKNLDLNKKVTLESLSIESTQLYVDRQSGCLL